MALERARRFVEQFGEQSCDPRLVRGRGTYRFDVEGASFLLDLEPGKLRLSEGTGAADCTFVCSEDDFVKVLRGEQNIVTAAMQGRITFSGDLALAADLMRVLPGPKQEAASQIEGHP